MLGNVRFSERNHLKPVSVRVLKKLDMNRAAAEQRVVAAGKSQSAGDEVDVRPSSQLMSAGPAEQQRVGAAGPGSTRHTGPVHSRIKQQYKGNILHYSYYYYHCTHMDPQTTCFYPQRVDCNTDQYRNTNRKIHWNQYFFVFNSFKCRFVGYIYNTLKVICELRDNN